MGKAARNRRLRREALELDPRRARSIARALRRHGRPPLKANGVSRRYPPLPRWTSRARRFTKHYADFRRRRKAE